MGEARFVRSTSNVSILGLSSRISSAESCVVDSPGLDERGGGSAACADLREREQAALAPRAESIRRGRSAGGREPDGQRHPASARSPRHRAGTDRASTEAKRHGSAASCGGCVSCGSDRLVLTHISKSNVIGPRRLTAVPEFREQKRRCENVLPPASSSGRIASFVCGSGTYSPAAPGVWSFRQVQSVS